MSTGLQVWSQVSDPLAAVKEYGEIIAKAGFFGCKTSAQGQALILMAMGENVPITEMRKKYHIVGGDLSMRADYVRAEFDRMGGVLTWLEQGDDGQAAAVRVKYKHHDLEVRYTITNAKAEGLIKAGSRWEKDAGSMLRARVSTKAIRMVCPAVFCGFASDEELIEQQDPDADAVEVREVNPAVAAVRAAVGSKTQATDSEPIEPTEPAAETVTEVSAEVLATGEQISRLTELFKTLGIDAAKQLAAIKRRGATDIASLTEEGAAEMIANLESKMTAANDEAAGESQMSDTATSLPVDAKASKAQIDQVRSLLKQISQTPGNADIGAKVRAHMEKHGLKQVADMAGPDADRLINGLTMKNLDAFFESSLKGAKAPF